MVVSIIVCEFTITIGFPYIEKWLLYRKDEEDLQLIRSLEEKTITRSDLKQLLEMVIAAVCDRLQIKNAYVVAPNSEGLEVVTTTGGYKVGDTILEELEKVILNPQVLGNQFELGNDTLIPLIFHNGNGGIDHPLGFLGIANSNGKLPSLDEEQEAFKTLIDRATLILRDRATQEQLFQTMERLNPQNEMIQQLRVAGRYNRNGLLNLKSTLEKNEIRQAVKDALTHYWGGPRLTESPLLKLSVVQDANYEGEQNSANALRSVLKGAIEHLQPEGDRKFTGEWLLYNILEMKFLEGKKVREIASKLALSEADLYRKQRVAIDLIADEIVKMEYKEIEGNSN
jgi:hypothetical protein